MRSGSQASMRSTAALSCGRWRTKVRRMSRGIEPCGSCTPPRRVSQRIHQLPRSEEHTSELQSLMRISYAVFCLKKKNIQTHIRHWNRLYTHEHTRPYQDSTM